MGDAKKSEEQKEDSSTQPSWLDKALIQQALHNAGENSAVEAITVTCPLAAGENYISTIYRVKATLTDGKEQSFIVKGPGENGTMAFMAEDSGVFLREIAMLTDLIPKMEALLEEAAPGRFPPLAPRCFHHGTSPVTFIVMEDLAPLGFKMADRRRGLGLRHSLLGMRFLARFHAASYALFKRQPELIEKLGSTLTSNNQELMDYAIGQLQALANGCRLWPGFEEYAVRLEKFKPVAGNVYDKLNEPKPGDFNVITHGDFWVNNMMYRCDDGNPQEFRAIDLQLSHACSPAIDLHHIFASSLSEDVYEHHRDLLLREYHFELKETMGLLGYQAPTLESLVSAMDARGTYALYLVLEMPIMRAEGGVDVDALSQGNYSGYLRQLELPNIKTRMQRILQEYAKKGWLPA